ncbi:MAG: NAD-dependent epimerase/dehydratase family protein [Candidatus Bathyarchaeota archaeon BA1]|nr:MAG: NAD-dependent epimerase/dehydratase family protein [Candidatus Bathyarchaeota archaeon BA1]
MGINVNTSVKDLKALVAGGSGFIGQHLVDALLKRGFLVRVFDLEARELAQIRNNRLELFIGDMLDRKAVTEVMKGINVVYHLALANSFEDFKSIQINLEGTNNLLETALNEGVKHFLFASSGVVYGSPRRQIMDEDHPLYPEESIIGGRWYGITKLATEKLCMKYYHEFGLPVTALRLGAVYLNVGWICDPIVSEALKGKKITVEENEWSDYIHMEDVVEAFLLATLNEKAYGEIFNITNPNLSISERELAEMIVKILKLKSKIGIVKGLPLRAKVTIGKARRLLKFKPRKGKAHLRKAIEQYLRAYKEQ